MNEVKAKRKYDWLNAWSIAVFPYLLIIPLNTVSSIYGDYLNKTNPFLWAELVPALFPMEMVTIYIGIPLALILAIIYLLFKKSVKQKKRSFRIIQLVINSLLTLYGIWFVSIIFLVASVLSGGFGQQ
jgi:hypothetical protein